MPIGGWVNFAGGGGGRGNSGGRSSEKEDSLPILGLQRLASLLMGKSLLPIRYFITFRAVTRVD